MNELSVTVAGNVASEVRSSAVGPRSCTRFRLAFNPRRRDGDRGWVDGEPQFYDVTCWGRLAENVAGSIRKGMPVVVQGRFSAREVEVPGQAGTTWRTYLDIDAHHVAVDLVRGTVAYTPTKSPAVVAAEERAIADARAVARLAG